MKVSAIVNTTECSPRRNLFIRFSNSFMSAAQIENPIEKANQQRPAKMGIESLEEFTIFPKEVKNGQTIITA